MQDIGLLDPVNGVAGDADSVNCFGQVVGQSGAALGNGSDSGQAFYYSGSGSPVNLGTLGGQSSIAMGINDSGQIAGYAQTASGAVHGALWTVGGATIDLGAGFLATAINNQGLIGGAAVQTQSAALYNISSGSVTNLGPLTGGTLSQVNGMSNGFAVGDVNPATASTTGFLFDIKTSILTDLTDPLGPSWPCDAASVNDFGQVVGGYAIDSAGDDAAFIYTQAGGMQNLNHLIYPSSGWNLTGCGGINDAGQIVGSGYNPQGQFHAFLLTPIVPEPSSLCLLIVAAAGFVAMKAKKLAGGQTASRLLFSLSRWTREIARVPVLSVKQIGTSLIAVFLPCATMVPAYASNLQYTITDLGVLDGPSSYATAMNNLGQVVGYADTYTEYSHAFLYAGSGPLLNLGSFGGDYSVSVATAINNSGMVVGYSNSSGSGEPTRAFLYTQSGGMQDLGTLGGQQAQATAINNLGQIVGYAQAPDGTYHGFLYSGNGPMLDLGSTYLPFCINDVGQVAAIAGSGNNVGTYISSGGTGSSVNIGSLGGNETEPYAMNNRGSIAGFSTTSASGLPQPFLYTDGQIMDLGTLGGGEGYAFGVNDSGTVVGIAALPGDVVGHGFVCNGTGPMQDLNNLVDPTLGWTLGKAMAVNDLGQIVVDGYQQYGGNHALLLTPVPEPEPSSLCLVCGAGLGFIAIRFVRVY